MSAKLRLFTALMAGMLAASEVVAQNVPAPAGPPLSVQAALDEALERNPALVALRRDYDTARTRPAQAGFLPPPMFEAQIWQWPINTLNPANANMYMFMLTQQFPGRGKRDLRKAVFEKDAEVADADIAVRARAVVDEVKRAYAELFLARKTVELTRANIDLLRQFANVSQAKYATGRVSQQDVLKAIVELSSAHENVVGLEERSRLAEAALDTLLGRAPDSAIGPLAEPRASVVLPPAATLQARAVSEQPELSVARLSIEQGDASLAAAESDYKPDFLIQGGYMVMPDMTDAWMAKVGISWPKAPWSRGRVDARVNEARAEIEARRARLAVAESAVKLAVQQAYVRVQSAAERARILETSLLPQASQVLDVSRAAYQTDRVDFLSLIDNQRQLLDLRIQYFRARTEVEMAWADLERAVGVDLDREPLAPPRASGPVAAPRK
jgi:cobalt-zinc-cadmium efflux system outer membrane protein